MPRGVGTVGVAERGQQRALLRVDAPQDPGQRENGHADRAAQLAEARPIPVMTSRSPV